MYNSKSKQHKIQKNYPGSVNSYDTRPGNEMGLLHPTPETTGGISGENYNKYAIHA